MKKILLGVVLVFFLGGESIAGDACSKMSTPREATKCLEEKIDSLQTLISSSKQLPEMEEDIKDLQSNISNIISIPKDAVLAFASASCPVGWGIYKEATGRVIVGSGLGISLSPRVFEQTGGSEAHKLTLSEIPKHAHSHVDDSVAYKPASRYEGLRTEFKGDSSVGLTHSARTTGAQGANMAHNNMPPFVVLTLCKQI